MLNLILGEILEIFPQHFKSSSEHEAVHENNSAAL